MTKISDIRSIHIGTSPSGVEYVAYRAPGDTDAEFLADAAKQSAALAKHWERFNKRNARTAGKAAQTLDQPPHPKVKADMIRGWGWKLF